MLLEGPTAPFRIGGKPPKVDIYTTSVRCQLEVVIMSVIYFDV